MNEFVFAMCGLGLGLIVMIVGVMRSIYSHRIQSNLFYEKEFLNRSVKKVFIDLHSNLPKGFHLLCEVSYGSLLRCDYRPKLKRISSKSASFVVLGPDLSVACLIEFEGSDHNKRQATLFKKTIALREADSPSFYLTKEYQPSDVVDIMVKVSELAVDVPETTSEHSEDFEK